LRCLSAKRKRKGEKSAKAGVVRGERKEKDRKLDCQIISFYTFSFYDLEGRGGIQGNGCPGRGRGEEEEKEEGRYSAVLSHPLSWQHPERKSPEELTRWIKKGKKRAASAWTTPLSGR